MTYTITFRNGSSIEVMGQDFSNDKISREKKTSSCF
jgi:hypothetical protein